jgi:hypothetical protein
MGQNPQGQDGWLQKLWKSVTSQLEDLSYISVTTCSGDTYANIDPTQDNVLQALKDSKVQILARTIYELDADIIKIIPMSQTDGKPTIDQEILKLHKESEQMAVANWNQFVITVMKVIELITSVIPGTKIDLSGLQGAISSSPQPPSGPT